MTLRRSEVSPRRGLGLQLQVQCCNGMEGLGWAGPGRARSGWFVRSSATDFVTFTRLSEPRAAHRLSASAVGRLGPVESSPVLGWAGG